MPKATRIIFSLLALLWSGLIWWLTTLPGRFFAGFPHFDHADKLVHLVMFAGFGFLWVMGLGSRLGITFLVIVLGVGYGALTEFHQISIIGRYASKMDLIADAIGVTGGVICALVLEMLVRWWRKRTVVIDSDESKHP